MTQTSPFSRRELITENPLADPSNFGDIDENDPKNMARFMKKMGKEMGEDMGEDFYEAMESKGEGGQEKDT